MKNYRPAGIALALLFMVLFLASLGLRLWASGKSSETVGPDHIAVGQDRVYVHVNGDLFILSAEGKLLDRKMIEPLVQDKLLIDMRVLQDGRLLLVKQHPAGIVLCETQHWQCEPLARAITGRIADQLKVQVDEASGTVYVSDFSGSRIWTAPLAGGEPAALTARSVLSLPNDIALGSDGRLWVADSGHRRIVALERRDNGAWVEVRSHDARNKHARPDRDWPMMLTEVPDGKWWVIQPTDRGGDGDLVVYHPDDGAVAKVELPEGAYPTDMALLDGAMLLTDMDRFRLQRVDVTTLSMSEFGDTQFRGIMNEGGERKALYLALIEYSLYGMIGFAALMILAAFWASPKDKRWTPVETAPALDASSAPPPKLKEVHWLRPNPKAEKQLRWVKPLLYSFPAIMLVIVGVMYFLFFGSTEAAELTPEKLEKTKELKEKFDEILILTIILAGSMPVLGLMALRSLKHRLGTDGHRLFVRLASGKQISLAPEQLVYSKRVIAFREYLFATRTGRGLSLYADGEIETFIAPLLARAKKLGEWDMFRYQLGFREPTLMVTIIFITLMTVLLIVTGAWRKVFPGLV